MCWRCNASFCAVQPIHRGSTTSLALIAQTLFWWPKLFSEANDIDSNGLQMFCWTHLHVQLLLAVSVARDLRLLSINCLCGDGFRQLLNTIKNKVPSAVTHSRHIWEISQHIFQNEKELRNTLKAQVANIGYLGHPCYNHHTITVKWQWQVQCC